MLLFVPVASHCVLMCMLSVLVYLGVYVCSLAQMISVVCVRCVCGLCTRIRKSGGFVAWNSHGQAIVNSRLAMTRSIGDFDLKQSGVIAEPETTRVIVSVAMLLKNKKCLSVSHLFEYSFVNGPFIEMQE